MTIEAELADGTVLEFPDGTPDTVVQATVKRMLSPQQPKSLAAKVLDRHPLFAAGETALALGTGAVAAPVAGLVGMAQGAKNALVPGLPAGERVREVLDAMTYKPRTEGGQKAAAAASYPFKLLAEGADEAGGYVADATGSPAAGAAVNTVIQAAPSIVLPLAGRAAVGPVNARAARIQAEVAAEQSRNAVRDATLQAGRSVGLRTPPSAINPSAINKVLESIAGKAATTQETQIRNQQAVNRVAREEAGLPPDTAITEQALQGVRAASGAPYREAAALPPIQNNNPYAGQFGVPQFSFNPATAIEALKQARADSHAQFLHYRRSADPAALTRARASAAEARRLEDGMEQAAAAAGRQDLIPMLRAARTQIAKTYDIERGLNLGDANVDPRSLGKTLDNRRLTGGLETIGQFTQAFEPYMREASRVTTPGVGALGPVAATALGLGGHAAAGPIGIAAAGLPFLRGPARSLVLSDWYQRLMAQPQYAQPITLPTQGANTLAGILATLQAGQQ